MAHFLSLELLDKVDISMFGGIKDFIRSHLCSLMPRNVDGVDHVKESVRNSDVINGAASVVGEKGGATGVEMCCRN